MMSSRWPRPTFVIETIDLMPVMSGSFTGWRSTTPGALNSSGRVSVASIGPRPSIGLPSGSTTRPSSASPTGTLATFPVRRTGSPSLTCSHCANFHKTTWPELKKRYIDTGKVRFVLREFPLDTLATAGFMLARCDGNDKYSPITDLLFEQQRNWAFVDKPLDALRGLMRQAGFSQEKFDACLKDQKLYDAVNAVKNRGMEQFRVDSTPTFFINGQRHPGSLSIDEIEKIIKPMLGE